MPWEHIKTKWMQAPARLSLRLQPYFRLPPVQRADALRIGGFAEVTIYHNLGSPSLEVPLTFGVTRPQIGVRQRNRVALI